MGRVEGDDVFAKALDTESSVESMLNKCSTVIFVLTKVELRVYELCFSPAASLWPLEDPLGSRHPTRAPSLGEGSLGRRPRSGRGRRSDPRPGSPPPLGLSQPLRPVRLFYSPSLMRAFNFSFTTSIRLLITHLVHDKNLLLAIMVSTTKPQRGGVPG